MLRNTLKCFGTYVPSRLNNNSSLSSTYVQVNDQPTNAMLVGSGPVYSQMQLYINGSLITTPGTYTIKACNYGTPGGTSCSTGSLTVTP
jgi:hypothetical protein